MATSTTPTVIVDNIPAADVHNGGIIHFGPDGMLYIFVGENDHRDFAQDLTSWRGKVLRFNHRMEPFRPTTLFPRLRDL